MRNKYQKIVAVDFDGTLCKDAYPAIGDPLPYSIHYIKELAKDGAILIDRKSTRLNSSHP